MARAAVPRLPIPIPAFSLKGKEGDKPARRANLEKEKCDKVPAKSGNSSQKKRTRVHSRPLLQSRYYSVTAIAVSRSCCPSQSQPSRHQGKHSYAPGRVCAARGARQSRPFTPSRHCAPRLALPFLSPESYVPSPALPVTASSVTRHGISRLSAASYCRRGRSPLPPPHLQCRRRPRRRSECRAPFRRPPTTNLLPNRRARPG